MKKPGTYYRILMTLAELGKETLEGINAVKAANNQDNGGKVFRFNLETPGKTKDIIECTTGSLASFVSGSDNFNQNKGAAARGLRRLASELEQGEPLVFNGWKFSWQDDGVKIVRRETPSSFSITDLTDSVFRLRLTETLSEAPDTLDNVIHEAQDYCDDTGAYEFEDYKATIQRAYYRVATCSSGYMLQPLGTQSTHNLAKRQRGLTERAIIELVHEIIRRGCLVNVTKNYPSNERGEHWRFLGMTDSHPKIHLYFDTTPGENPTYERVLSSKIQSIEITDKEDDLANDWDFQRHLRSGEIPRVPNTRTPEIFVDQPNHDVKLRIFGDHDELNLDRVPSIIHDLAHYPLSPNQELTYYESTKQAVLTIPKHLIDIPFIEWIFARMENVEVIEPKALRQYLVKKLDRTCGRYQ